MTAKRSDDVRRLGWFAVAGGAGVLFYLLGPILTPFLLAAILAYVCDPLVSRLEGAKIPRTPGTLLVLLFLAGIFVLLVFIMIPLMERQIVLFLQRLPGYLDWLKSHLGPWLEANLGVDLQLDIPRMREALTGRLLEAGGPAGFLPYLKKGGQAVVAFFVNLALVPVVLFYLLRDWRLILARVEEMIPRRWHGQVVAVAREVDTVLGGFLRGQVSVMLLMGLFYSTGLWLAGLELALPIGILSGLLGFVPYLGVITGVGTATLAAFLQFQSLGGLLPVWGVFILGQVMEGMVLTPWLVGDRIGLHPVAVIFAVLAFGQLFGFFGVLLALPMSAVLVVGLRFLRRKYLESGAYRS
jgi:predicted PurR-regulated permease PerM